MAILSCHVSIKLPPKISDGQDIYNYSSGSGDPGTLTIGSGITIAGQAGTIGNSSYPLINQGTIDADVSGGTIYVNGTNWSNAGTLEASNGGTLNLSGTWTDAGTVTAGSGSTVDLGGTFSLGSGYAFTGGGALDLQGTLNNAGTTLSLSGSAPVFTLQSGTISGGTINLTNGATLIGSSGTLSGVTLDGTLDMAEGYVTVTDGLTLDGTIELGPAVYTNYYTQYSTLVFRGAQTLTGTGTIIFGGDPQNQIDTASANSDSGTLTIGPGITIAGQAGTIGNSSYPLINQGTIDADVSGGTINVNGTNWSNAGTLEASNGGTLNLSGTWTDAGTVTAGSGSEVDLGGTFSLGSGYAFTGGGALDLQGTLNNSGTTLSLSGSAPVFTLQGGTISGGTIDLTNGATLIGSGTLSGVTLAGTLDLSETSSSVIVTGGLTLDQGTIKVGSTTSSYSGYLYFIGTQTLGGTGSVVLGESHNNEIYNYSSGSGDSGTLTIGSGITIAGHAGTIGNSSYPLINQGTIDADVSGGTIYVNGTNWSNAGTLEAANGGVLGLQGAWSSSTPLSVSSGGTINAGGTLTNSGSLTFDSNGTGTLNFIGTVDNTGGTITLAGNGMFHLGVLGGEGGTITGGTVDETGGATLTGGGGTLDGVTVNGDIDLTAANMGISPIGYTIDNDTLTITDGLTLNGTITLGGAPAVSPNEGDTFSVLVFDGTQTLAGNGTIVLAGAGGVAFNGASHPGYNTLLLQTTGSILTVAPGFTIRGQSGEISGVNNTTLVNQGTIAADTADSSGITIDTTSMTNSGTLETANGGALTTGGNSLTDTGIIEADGTSTLNLSSGSVTINSPGVLRVQPSATVEVTSSLFGDTTDADLYQPQGAVNLAGSGTSTIPQFLEAMSDDLGNVSAGFQNNFAYNTLAIGSNDYVRLVNLSNNSGSSNPEAVYVNTLIVPSGSTLDLNGLNLYYRTGQINGTITAGSATPLTGGGLVALNTANPGNIQVQGEVDDWSFFGRAGEPVDIFLHTGSGGIPTPISPALDYGQWTLIDPSGNP